MRPELRSLILDYQTRVAEAVCLLEEQLKLKENGWLSWRQSGVKGSGWLDEARDISYRYHGIGCCVMFDQVDVDFDSGPDGRIDGFDAWRLSIFAQTVRKHAAFTDCDSRRQELADLHALGELVSFPNQLGSHLFFFPDHVSPTGDDSQSSSDL